LPALAEQVKIAEFLLGIDRRIIISSYQLEKMVVWKKGLLQQLFV